MHRLCLFLTLAALLGSSCSSGILTPAEAEAQLDIACAALVRSVANAQGQKPVAILNRVCEGRQSRELIEQLLASPSSGSTLLTETFPLERDAGL